MKKLFNISVKLFILLIIVMITSVIYAQDTTLTLWVYDDGRLEVLTQLGEEFEAEYGVAVDVQVVTLDEIRNAMSLGAAAGEGPDMVIIPHDNLGPMVVNGAAAPIDLGDAAENYLPNAIDGFTYDGQLYGVPLAVENIGFFRNTDLVPDAPATWDEVAEIGSELFDNGEVDSAIGFPDLTYNTRSSRHTAATSLVGTKTAVSPPKTSV